MVWILMAISIFLVIVGLRFLAKVEKCHCDSCEEKAVLLFKISVFVMWIALVAACLTY